MLSYEPNLVLSNQGRNNFKVYERTSPHAYVGTFAIQGVKQTDGIDVTNLCLSSAFPSGLFACHAARRRCPVILTAWHDIANSIRPVAQTGHGPNRSR